MTYPEALAYVSGLEPRGWRLGLDRMQAFIDRAGLSQNVGRPPGTDPAGKPGARFIHVAGTNGKGSVTAFLQSMLVEHGYRTGAFFSPYVVDPRERVQFGRSLISESDFASVVAHLKPIAESFSETEFGGITEFEFKTAVGVEYWRRKRCEWVALEVGLGGRLDATNVVHPACSAIVSIGYDHTQILGDTLEKIAFEKAGIVKPETPLVVGDVPEPARRVIDEVADSLAAPVWHIGSEIEYAVENGVVRVCTPLDEVRVQPSLHGEIQAHNVALAFAAMQRSLPTEPQALAQGALHAYVPGRFEEVEVEGVKLVLDGAHNSEAARVLAETLAADRLEGLVAIVGMTDGHDPLGFIRAIAPRLRTIHAVPIDYHRSQRPEAIAAAAGELGVACRVHETVPEALRAAQASGGPILVTGSFYLVGEVLRHLKLR